MPDFVMLRYTADKPYIPDYATAADTDSLLTASVRYKIPTTGGDDLARAAIDVINSNSGADVYKIGDEIVNEEFSNLPCPESTGGFSPRKLVFISDKNQSFSVPIADRTNLIAARDAIRNSLNGNNFNVVCIKLEGETHRVLNEILSVNTTDATVADPDPSTTGNGTYYSGRITYETDGGITRIAPVKIMTDTAGQAPSALATSWASCVGAFNPSNGSCGGAAGIKHRRYIAQFQTTGDGVATREIPVKARAAADILACGNAIVTDLGGAALCMSYTGESYKLFHKIATPAATP